MPANHGFGRKEPPHLAVGGQDRNVDMVTVGMTWERGPDSGLQAESPDCPKFTLHVSHRLVPSSERGVVLPWAQSAEVCLVDIVIICHARYSEPSPWVPSP